LENNEEYFSKRFEFDINEINKKIEEENFFKYFIKINIIFFSFIKQWYSPYFTDIDQEQEFLSVVQNQVEENFNNNKSQQNRNIEASSKIENI